MSRIVSLSAAVAAALALTAVTQAQTQQSAQTQMEQRPAPQLPERDEDFIKDVAQASQVEIETSKLAATKATNPEVKAYAEKLVKDHTDASAELMSIVHAKNAMWPAEDPGFKAKKEKHASLQTLTGAAFDKEYLEDMISDHENAMAMFGRYGQAGKDAAMKAYVEKTLPALREHLTMARDLRAKIAK